MWTTKKRTKRDNIYTQDGSAIPRVSDIRVLGVLLNEKGNNGGTMAKIVGKAASAIRLMKRVSNGKRGLRDENLTRLV